jgi:hypothetical protein
VTRTTLSLAINALDQSNFRNYALLQDSGGTTHLNSPNVILLRIAALPSVAIGPQGKIVLGSRGGEGSIGFGVNPVHPITLAGAPTVSKAGSGVTGPALRARRTSRTCPWTMRWRRCARCGP